MENQNVQLGPFDESDSYRTLALVVEGRKFWVPRDLLAAYSPVFKTMLYREFAEATKTEIILPDKKADDIQELLMCLIPSPETKSIDLSNADLMLGFANEYQIAELRRRAILSFELMMKNCGRADNKLLQILRIGSKYHLKEIFQECVKRCGTEFSWGDLQPIFEQLRGELVAGVMIHKFHAPYNLKCRFIYSVRKSTTCKCAINNCYLQMECIYCCARCCGTCLNDGKLENSVCKPLPVEKADGTVCNLLKRL